MTVGTSGTATVEFTLDSAYEGNYIKPDESDATTYIDYPKYSLAPIFEIHKNIFRYTSAIWNT